MFTVLTFGIGMLIVLAAKSSATGPNIVKLPRLHVQCFEHDIVGGTGHHPKLERRVVLDV